MDNKNIDYEKEFTCGTTTISRNDYECMPFPMNTSHLSDDEMQGLADAIEYEMTEWREWLEDGVVTEDKYREHWWKIMLEIGQSWGITYYEDDEYGAE